MTRVDLIGGVVREKAHLSGDTYGLSLCGKSLRRQPMAWLITVRLDLLDGAHLSVRMRILNAIWCFDCLSEWDGN